MKKLEFSQFSWSSFIFSMFKRICVCFLTKVRTGICLFLLLFVYKQYKYGNNVVVLASKFSSHTVGLLLCHAITGYSINGNSMLQIMMMMTQRNAVKCAKLTRFFSSVRHGQADRLKVVC